MSQIRWSLFVAAAASGSAALPPIADAAEPADPLLAPRQVMAHRADAAIRIDGALDDAAWRAAPVAEQFLQSRPAPGAPARLRTRFQVAFDEQALYVAVRLDDAAAWAIQAPLGRRDDENSSDWCFVEIDSRRDRRTAYSLGVNPAGMQVDGVFVNDVEYDTSWNGVWEAATRVDDGGWTAEYRIPFAMLAFQPPSSGEPMRWGINVYRSNPHTGEASNWSPRLPSLAGVVSLFNEVVIAASPNVRRVEVTPYALTQVERGGSPTMRAGVDAASACRPALRSP
jgi:hypothetical protein